MAFKYWSAHERMYVPSCCAILKEANHSNTCSLDKCTKCGVSSYCKCICSTEQIVNRWITEFCTCTHILNDVYIQCNHHVQYKQWLDWPGVMRYGPGRLPQYLGLCRLLCNSQLLVSRIHKENTIEMIQWSNLLKNKELLLLLLFLNSEIDNTQ